MERMILTKFNFRMKVPFQICTVPFDKFLTNEQTLRPGQANGRSGGSETEYKVEE